jgi:D-3-phosphoglycerate dehydrogenase
VSPGIDTVENLILDLLEWVDWKDRTYEEVLDAWRTSCPRLPVWEEANDLKLVAVERVERSDLVRVTPRGHELLDRKRPRRVEVAAAHTSR